MNAYVTNTSNTHQGSDSLYKPAHTTILTPELMVQIDSILERFAKDPTRLVGMLLDIQDITPKQYLPKEIAVYVGEKLDLPLSRVYDVISFYEALSDVPRADIVIQFCDSVVCKVVGSRRLKEALEGILDIKTGETTKDGKYHLEAAPCFGACDISPAIRVNGVVYGPLKTEEDVRDALARYEKGGEARA
ncbi:complex I 24 kDa subunit family protein [Acidaminobacter sp.]|uniref:NADH-quinone oxidoreductase subunit NuoE family protein n=1 Tax=Acidaminobacter sp. TaxID=1872102 RepID=UPI002564633B|nr:NAD(P)H-dependent oxidoreductase subunit E [Acidaminobacter sp.]MDK9711534.1 NAD(P)H-dependent oxidoreductase subunit E [Acidaminobacter sp.]